MPSQTSANVLAAVKRELAATPGVAAAGGAGALLLRLLDSPGASLTRGQIRSGERRNDMIRPMGRLGNKQVGSTYNAELTIGGATDEFITGILRNDWVAALSITEATGSAGAVTIATSGSNMTITRTGGSWITDGVRVGDVLTFTAHPNTANVQGKRMRVVAVTALTVTVAGSPVSVAASAAAWTLTRLKKIITPTSPVRRSYTIEQYEEDIDTSELFKGLRLTQVSFQFRPNAVATVVYTMMGIDRELIASIASPYFTNPAETTGAPLVADDSAIRFNGQDVTRFTSLDITLAIEAATLGVIGSLTTPDVYDNMLSITGAFTCAREDHAKLAMYDAETEFELSSLFTEPGADPRPAFGVYLPRVKMTNVDSPFLGGDTAKLETVTFEAAPQAADAAAGRDATAINFFSSAAI